jgi:hypothetical protein
MAQDTPADLRNLVMDSVFVRQHLPGGTFAAVEADLPRSPVPGRELAWLLPIHPIREVPRTGTLGSPCSIRNDGDPLADRPVTVADRAIPMPAVAAILRNPGEHALAPTDLKLPA